MADQREAIVGVIDANRVAIINAIIITPSFKAHLIQKRVFTPDVNESIFRKCWTQSEQLEEMIHCLRKRINESGCEVLCQFLRCLQDTDHKHISKTLYHQMRAAAIEVGGMQEVNE